MKRSSKRSRCGSTRRTSLVSRFQSASDRRGSFEQLEARLLLFKPYTHIEIGKDVLADVLPDGMISINGNDYSVDPAVVSALNIHPRFYNAGVVGPDAFPDMVFGQGDIHPSDTGKWASHVLTKAWQAQSDSSYSATEKSQILAWSFGFLTHLAGDIWSHTLVNEFADGPFPPFTKLTETANLENALRHVFAEGYIGDATPGYDGNPNRTTLTSGDVSDDSTPAVPFDAPHKFVFETFVKPNSGQPVPARGKLIEFFQNLRARLEELAADPVVGDDIDVTGQITNADAIEDAKGRVDQHCTVLGMPLDVTNADCRNALKDLGIEGFEKLTQDLLNLSDSQAESARRELLRAYLRAWIKDIDKGLEAWSELGLATANAFFDPQARRDLQNSKCAFYGPETSLTRANCEDGVGPVEVFLDQSNDFINDHLLSMMGAPDFVGGLRTKLQDFGDFIEEKITGPLRLKFHPVFESLAQLRQSAEDILKQAVEDRFGFDINSIGEFLSSPSSKLGLEKIGPLDIFALNDRLKLDNYLGITGTGNHNALGFPDFVTGAIFHPGALGGLKDTVTFDKNTFAAYANSVRMSKLLLLSGSELGQVFSDLIGTTYDVSLLHANGPQSGNIMTMTLPQVRDADGKLVDSAEWLTSIDEEHQWRADGQPQSTDPRGNGNFPLWESCLLRNDAFRTVFTDWENGSGQFPDLGDAASRDPNEKAPDVWYFDKPAYFSGTKTLLVNGIPSHLVEVEGDATHIWVEWTGGPTYCAAQYKLPKAEVAQVLVNGISIGNVSLLGNLSGVSVTVSATTLPGQISGAKWNDVDADGTKEVGEPGLQHWKIFLDTNPTHPELEPTRYTLPNGSYAFAGLPLAAYSVFEEGQDGWKKSAPTTASHSVTLTSGIPTDTDVDFGNFQSVAAFDWLTALGTWIDSTLTVRQNPLGIIGFDKSLDDLINIPFLKRNISEIVDFAGLFREIDTRLLGETQIDANSAVSSFSLSSPAHFIINPGGIAPVEVSASTPGINLSINNLIDDLNDALTAAGLDDQVEFFEVSTNKLGLKSVGPGLIPSLTMATLRLTAANAGPANGQLTADVDPFTVKITRKTVDENGTSTTQPEESYSFTIGAAPPIGGDTYPHTQDNVTLADLAQDLNDGLVAESLFDVIAVVNPGSDGNLGTNDDKLVIAAANPNITKIKTDAATGSSLGFSNNQSIDDTSNNDPAFTVLKFSGGNDIAERSYDSIQEMLPLVEAVLIDISTEANDSLPLTYMINPTYDVDRQTVEFDLRVNHLFKEPIELDTFEKGVPLGPLGTLEISAGLDVNATIPTKLDIRVGLFLGERTSPFSLSEKTKLSWLNGEDGVQLNVGTTATNVVPANDQPGQDITFTISWLTESGVEEQEFTLSSNTTDDPTTADNSDADSLASDLNNLFRLEALGDTFRAEVQTTTIRDASGQVTGTEERLTIVSVDADIRSFSIKGTNINLLGFDATEHKSNHTDLSITIGTPLSGDDNCTDNVCSFTVDLDGSLTVGDLIDKIQAKPGSGTSPAVTVKINESQDALLLEAQNPLIVSNAFTPTEITKTPSTTSFDDGTFSLAATGLGIAGLSTTTSPYTLTGETLDGQSIEDRVHIVERNASSIDKNLRMGVGIKGENIDASAAFGQVGLQLTGDAEFRVDVGTNFRDPGRKLFNNQPDDERIDLSESFSIPPQVLVLNPLHFSPPAYFANANLELSAMFGATAEDILKELTGQSAPNITLTATADSLNKKYDFEIDTNFDEIFDEIKDLKASDFIDLIIPFLDSLIASASNNATSGDSALAGLLEKLPFANKSLDDVARIAQTIKEAVQELIASVDLDAVSDSIDSVETAIWNLGIPLEDREDLLGAVDVLRRGIANSDDVDVNFSPRLPTRLLAATRRLAKAYTDDVDSLTTPPAGKQDLLDAIEELLTHIPALNTIEERLSQLIEDKLSDALGISGTEVEFDLGIVDNVNTAGDRGLVVGLTIDKPTILSENFVPDIPADSFGPFEFAVDPQLGLDIGGEFSLGFAFNLTNPQSLVLVNPPATFDGVPLHKSEIDLNVGFTGTVSAMGSFGSLDTVHIDADLSLLSSRIDEFPPGGPTGFFDGVVALTKTPESGTDGRFVIVAVGTNQTDGTVDFEVLRAGDDYDLVLNGAITEVHLLNPTDYATANFVTVEYHSTDAPVSGKNPSSNVADRATVKLDLEPTAPINNFIGGIPFADLFDDARFRLDTQGRDSLGNNPTHGSLIVGSVDPTLLNSLVDDAITVAASLQYLSQPQIHVDENALTELLEGVDFNLKTILLGIEAFLETLEDGLTSEIMTKLPVVGDGFDAAGTFVGNLRTRFLEPFIDVVCQVGGDFDSVAMFIENWIYGQLGPGGAVGPLGILADRDGSNLGGLADSVADVDVVLDKDHFEVLFSLKGEDKMVVDFDTGLAGLPIDASGQGGVELGWEYNVDFGVGVHRNEGFYFIVNNNDADPEFKVDIGAGLIVDTSGPDPLPTSIGVNLFGLNITATDNNNGNNPGTHIDGMLTLNLADAGTNDDHLPLAEIGSMKFGEIFEADLTATVAVDLHFDAGVSSNLPSVEADLVLGWTANVGNTVDGGIEVSASGLEFSIVDLGINLGDFLSKHIGRALDTINRYIEPIKPVIKLLKQEVPGVSQASEAAGQGKVTFLDLAFAKNPDRAAIAKQFVDAIDLIINLADSLKSVDDSDKVSFVLVDEIEIIENDGDDGGLTGAGWNDSNEIEDAAEAAPKNGLQTVKAKIQDLLQKVEDLGINLHILEPKNLVNLLLGRPFDVISYELPRFELPFTWEKSFRPVPVFPPLALRIGLDAGIFADLSVGYDSHGIDTGNFFDGFYFGDREDVFEGEDIDEFGLGVGVRLAALLDILVASAGVEGEIRADILANWRDVDSNGKMYLDEIVSIVKQDGLECLFDLRGELRAIVRLVWEVLGKDGDKELINKILFSFQNKCPKYELGHVVEGTVGPITAGPSAVNAPGTLIIHTGPFASQRRSGTTSDVAEDVTVTQLAPGVFKVEMLGLESRYTGVEHIYFDGGNQNDKLTLVKVDVAVTAFGGAGDDELHGTRRPDYIDGGAGDDKIRGRGDVDNLFGGSGSDLIYGDLGSGDSTSDWGTDAGDTIDGGGGDDTIVAAGGTDTVDAGSGNDLVYGHKNDDLTITFGIDGPDTLRGGNGNDIIYGAAGADMIFGDGGADQLYGEAAGDTIHGGAGNDFALGDAGDDEIHGGSGRDIISGGINPDKLFGDDGADLIAGGLLTQNAQLKILFQSMMGASNAFVAMIVTMESPGPDVADELWGGRDGDLLVGDAGGDQLLGGWGDDSIIAHQILDPTTTAVEYIEGGPNNDFICGAHGQDEIYGGTSTVGLAHILADQNGPSLGGGFSMTACDSVPVIIVTPDPAEVSGKKFNDMNANGIRDVGEPGLPDWTIDLYDADGDLVDSHVTDSSGDYKFIDLDPGIYRVEEQPQTAWRQTSPGGIDLRDIATNPANGDTYAISSETLYSIDMTTGAATAIAPLVIASQATMAFSGSGRLFTMGYGNPNLYEINLTTGAATTVLNTGQTADGGLAYHPVEDKLYLSNGNSLVRINLASNTASVVGSHGISGVLAMKVGDSGGLFAVDTNLKLYRINTSTGAASPVASTETFANLGLSGLSLENVAIVSSPTDTGYEFTILAGQKATDIDFGNRFQGAEIRGRKFHDLNVDGVRNSGESYLNGWGIELYDELGQLAGSTLTADLDLNNDANIDTNTEKGWYVFSDLPPGTYTVTEVARPDWVQTLPKLPAANVFQPIVDDGYTQTKSDVIVGGLGGTITDINVTLNIQHGWTEQLRAFLLSPSGNKVELFAGVGADGNQFTNTSLDDEAATDIDDNSAAAPFTGSFRPVDLLSGFDGESPNGNWTLVIEDNLEGETGRLLDWNLTVSTSQPTTLSFSGGTPNPHSSSRLHYYEQTVVPDQTVTNLDFGNYQAASIDGIKFSDINGNQVRDPGEPGLAGVTIFVDLNNNGIFDRGEPSTITAADDPETKNINEAGTFTLSPIAPGQFFIREVVTSGYVQTFPATTNLPLPGAHSVSLISGSTVKNPLVFGNQPLGSIHGTKWNDIDGDGVRDPNEPGIAGVTIFVDLNGNGQLDLGRPGEPRAVSMRDDPRTKDDEAGMYWLENVPLGNHIVREIVPAGATQTSAGNLVVYANDFESQDPLHGEWSVPRVGVTPAGQRRFLGLFENNDVMLQLATVPAHQSATVSFDLFVVGDWIGNGGPGLGSPDRFALRVVGGETLIDTTFAYLLATANNSDFVPDQAHPGTYSTSFHSPTTGAIEVNVLGFPNPAGGSSVDTVYHFELTFEHSASFLRLVFEGDGLEANPAPAALKAWGIDNVQVTVPVGYHSVTVESPKPITGIDFGNVPTTHSSIHGQKWNDKDGDGKRGPREYGIDGWTINLVDSDGNIAASQRTMSMDLDGNGVIDPFRESGLYWFDNVQPGTYTVTETQVPGWTQTVPAPRAILLPGDSNQDCEFNSSDLVRVFQIAKYENDRPATFAEGDWNADGIFSSSDFIAAFVIGHYEQGAYCSPGQNTHLVTIKRDQTVHDLDFANRREPTELGEIRGTKWFDENANGVRDPSEPGRAQVTVYWDANLNGQLDPDEPRSLTANDGQYRLTGVPMGNVVVREIIPSGFRATFPANGVYEFVLSSLLVTGVDFGNARDNPLPPPAVPNSAVPGMVTPGSIHGHKWEDLDGDSVRDTGEPPLAGVTIWLDLNNNGLLDEFVDATGVHPEPSMVTGANGEYWFMDLQPGRYVVREIVPSGFAQTFPPVPPAAHIVTLDFGVIAEGRDFGNRRTTSSIHGTKFIDRLAPFGQWDQQNEPGLANVVIFLDLNNNGSLDANEPATKTMVDDPRTPQDETGQYWFMNVKAGTYSIREVVPPGMVQSFPTDGRHIVQVGQSPTAVHKINFGNRPIENSSIHGIKFLDVVAPFGQWNPTVEPGLAGVTIYVDVNNNGQLDPNEPSAVTMQDDPKTPASELGHYWLTDISPGRYFVREVVPFGYTQTFPGATPGAAGGSAHIISLAGGESQQEINFGNRPVQGGSIHGTKWLDSLDPLGERNPEEPGLAGVTIYLDLNNNGVLDDGETSTLTMHDDPATPADETGMYWFQNVPGGTYVVREVVPAEYIQSFPLGQLGAATLEYIGISRSPIDGLLYGVKTTGELEIIHDDLSTTPVGSLRFAVGEGDIDFNPANGVLYVISSGAPSRLYRVDLGVDAATNAPVILQTISIGNIAGAVDPSAMAFDTLGELVVLDLNPTGTRLLTIDPVDASVDGNIAVALATTQTTLAMDYEPLLGLYVVANPEGLFALSRDGGIGLARPVDEPGLSGIAFSDDRYHAVAVRGQEIIGIDFGNFEPEYLPDGDDRIFGQNDVDLIYGDNVVPDPRVISTGSRMDTIFGQAGADRIFGQEETDTLSGGSDAGSPANDSLDGGLGIDRVFQEVNNHQTLTNSQLVGEGIDSLTSIERATLIGGASNNTINATGFSLGPVILFGMAGDDTLLGTNHEDELDGGAGSDVMQGGLGGDRYVFGSAVATPNELDTINEGAVAGIDTLDFSAVHVGVKVDLMTATIATHPISSPTRQVQMSSAGQQANIENVVGTAFNDTITGNGADNVILAGLGSDMVNSGGGNDTIDLGSGASDNAAGGPGDDRYRFTNGWGTAAIIELPGDGNDTLDLASIDVPLMVSIGSLQVTDGTNTITHALSQIENVVSGSANDKFIFSDGAMLPNGGSIDSGAGIDLFDFSMYTSGVIVDLQAGSATASSATISVAGIENVTGGSAADNITGDGGSNILIGGPDNDTILGLSGDDEIRGNAGLDNLDGGVGNDLLVGGTQNDVMQGGPDDDTFVIADGDSFDVITELAGGGADTLDLSLMTSGLTLNVGTILDIDLSSGGNVVDASNRIESILLGKANDAVVLADGASVPGTISGATGTNLLDYSAYTTGIVVDLAAGTATGTMGVSHFANVTGGSAGDTITGDDSVNILDGRSGDDTLRGGGDNDILIGGPAILKDDLHGESGNDTYVVTTSSTTLVLHENGGTVSSGFASIGGTDAIDLTALTGNVTLNLTLATPQFVTTLGPSVKLDQPQHFENILGSLTAANVLTGNSADNLLVGGGLADTITGGNGDDILVGSGGNDNLNGQAGNDIIIGGANNDSVLVGGIDRDIIIGGLGQDGIDGQADDDILIGGTTNYDNPLDSLQLVALEALRLEWISSTKSYTTRVTNLGTGVGPSNAYKLTTGISGTVQDDSVADTAVGGSGRDLYFVQSPDLSDKNPANEVFAVPIAGLDDIAEAVAETIAWRTIKKRSNVQL